MFGAAKNPPGQIAMVQRLLDERGLPLPRPLDDTPPVPGEIPVERYVSAAWLVREQARVFGALPNIVAHASELAAPGACLPVTVGGVALVVVRQPDGSVRAFRNACRHRGTQLVSEPCSKKSLVCPYHAWTYDLAGGLKHVPHEETFGGLARARGGLVGAHAVDHAGFIWASLAPIDVTAHLGGMAREMLAMHVHSPVLYRRSMHDVHANWKLIIDAFLEGYHLRVLHAKSVGPFFIHGRSTAEREGLHVRTATARRALEELPPNARAADIDVRTVATPSNYLFPNAVCIFHPDYSSVVLVNPVAPDRTAFAHYMLVPAGDRSDETETRYQRSFQLIDEVLLDQEDLAAVEAIQRGFAARANETLLTSSLEEPLLWFHATVDDALAEL